MRLLQLVVCAVLTVLTGCAAKKKDPTVPVTGSVSYRGQPVDGATVMLVPADTKIRSASGVTDAQGKFAVMTYFNPQSQPKGAMPGDYTITVSKMTAAAIPAGLSPQEEQAAFSKAPPKPLLPKAYLSPKTSKLKVKVEAEAPEPLKLDLKD